MRFLTDIPADIRGGIIGIVGTILGVIVARVLQRTGRLSCMFSEWSFKYYMKNDNLGGEIWAVERPESYRRIKCSFHVEFFNSMDVTTGIHSIEIQFRTPGGHLVTAPLHDDSQRFSVVKGITLPSRQFTSISVAVHFGSDETRLPEWDRAYLRFQYIDGWRTHRRLIAKCG